MSRLGTVDRKGLIKGMEDAAARKEKKQGLLDEKKGSGLSDAEVAVMYGLVDANGEYDEDAVQALQEQLAEAAGAQEDLDLRLQGLGLGMFEMEGDGNCQFRALADQLFGDQKHHAVTRQAAVDHMRRHADFFGMYFEDASELNVYLKEMGRSRTWGDELTLRAAVEAYGCCAHVITSEPANWYLVYQPEGEPLSSMPLPEGHAAPRKLKEVFVSYISPISMVKVPPWWGHIWPPRAPQGASEGLGLPSALGRRG